MSLPIHVHQAFEKPLTTHLRLTKKFGGPVEFSWNRQTISISLPKPIQDSTKCWVDNQLIRVSAKYSRPTDAWTVEAHGIDCDSKVKTQGLVDLINKVFSKAKEQACAAK